MNHPAIKRALISVSDKTGLIPFARGLADLGIDIISTGGTSAALTEAGITHQKVEALTGLPEMLGGRVKTLHPKLHGGILGLRDTQAEEAKAHQIEWIDLVVVNLYPFEKSVTALDMPWSEVVDYIDIGGPAMIRAAAKNFAWVGVVVNPQDYEQVLNACQAEQGLSLDMRLDLAEKAFALTAAYDAHIQAYFVARHTMEENPPAKMTLSLINDLTLRYGENPHQLAYAYRFPYANNGLLTATQHQGKSLSYNNILDAEAAVACVSEFSEPACVIVKHANPCGVAVASTPEAAYAKAFAADAKSAFGGIIAFNRPCTEALAKMISTVFMEVVIAPSFTAEALALFASKPNLRCLSMKLNDGSRWEMRGISGGVLIQERDIEPMIKAALLPVTRKKPSERELDDLLFAWQVVKHVKSNGILIAKEGVTVGMGAGQVSRVDAVELALRKGGRFVEGAVLASDAFFPFRDAIDSLAGTGIRAIIQPGGSVRDEEVIEACNEHDIAMVHTGQRCFKH